MEEKSKGVVLTDLRFLLRLTLRYLYSIDTAIVAESMAEVCSWRMGWTLRKGSLCGAPSLLQVSSIKRLHPPSYISPIWDLINLKVKGAVSSQLLGVSNRNMAPPSCRG